MTCGTDIKAMANAADRYQDNCAGSVLPGQKNILFYKFGYGTTLIMAKAAANCGASSVLFVVSKPAIKTYQDQLTQAGYHVTPVDGRKSAGQDACHEAMRRTGNSMRIFLASDNAVSGIGHWYEAWPQKTPFDFAAVLDPHRYMNSRSERARGMDVIIKRAATALLMCGPGDIDHVPDMIGRWGAAVCGCPSVKTCPIK